MLWFKNAIVYELTKDNSFDKQKLAEAVNAVPFVACGSTDTSKSGWVSPYGENGDNPLLVDIEGQVLLRLKKEIKMLPSFVVKRALEDKIKTHEEGLARKLSKAEKLALKDEVYIDLLPRAFSKYLFYWVWIDTKNQRIVVDTGSFKQAEDILALLRKEMGSLSLIPLASEAPLEKIMTKWVREGQEHAPLIIGDEIELKDNVEDNAFVKCKNQDLVSNEIFIHIDAGKQVNKLKLFDERGVSFLLNRDNTFQRIKFDAAVLDKNEDYLPEEREKRLEADFIIMSNTLSDMINSVMLITNQIES